MTSQVILIKWPYSREYVEISWSNTGAPDEITKTKEWWKSTKSFVDNNTSSTARKSQGGWVIEVHYEESMNPHINATDTYWGYSRFQISPDAEDGRVSWHDKHDRNRNGDVAWSRISTDLLKPIKRIATTQIEREQAFFRSILLEHEDCCAITGENTISALEAAHIIPSKDGGAEVAQNGILLRADIHRLFDSGLFRIHSSGDIVDLSDTLSPAYKTLLKNRKIGKETIERIRPAIAYLAAQGAV